MKFTKFVKTLASSGILYQRENGERWLASEPVFMKIPDGVASVTARSIKPMPKKIDDMIDQITQCIPAHLYKAFMIEPDSGIKGCIRQYRSDDRLYTIDINNDSWSLIDHGDMIEIEVHYDAEDGEIEPAALRISEYPAVPSDDPYVVGIIFPTEI